jgi:hypothetical protein
MVWTLAPVPLPLDASPAANRRFTLGKIKQAFTDDERYVGSVSQTIDDLLRKKHVKRAGGGIYEVIPGAPAKTATVLLRWRE